MIEALGSLALLSAGVGTLSAFWFWATSTRELPAANLDELRERRDELVAMAERARTRPRWFLHVGLALGLGLVVAGLSVDGAGGWGVLGGILACLATSGFLVDLGSRRRLERALDAIGE
ncbi:MAG: hypothetical protein R3290_02955 [Acidimicrobiia bacterium]|nr:hypothetical protein [Acidimicrobiia bacterium]